MELIKDLLYYIPPFILVLTIVVFIHEFGHFWVARKAGVKVIGIMPGNSPLASICDFPITINVGENYRITKPHTSRIAYTAVIDVITMGVAQLKPEAQDHLYNIVDSQRSLKID